MFYILEYKKNKAYMSSGRYKVKSTHIIYIGFISAKALCFSHAPPLLQDTVKFKWKYKKQMGKPCPFSVLSVYF